MVPNVHFFPPLQYDDWVMHGAHETPPELELLALRQVIAACDVVSEYFEESFLAIAAFGHLQTAHASPS